MSAVPDPERGLRLRKRDVLNKEFVEHRMEKPPERFPRIYERKQSFCTSLMRSCAS
jgi:hypothetical protein